MQFFGNLLSKVKGQKTLSFVPNEYKCQYCKQIFPLDQQHFQVVKNFKYGYSTVCLECGKPKPREEK